MASFNHNLSLSIVTGGVSKSKKRRGHAHSGEISASYAILDGVQGSIDDLRHSNNSILIENNHLLMHRLQAIENKHDELSDSVKRVEEKVDSMLAMMTNQISSTTSNTN